MTLTLKSSAFDNGSPGTPVKVKISLRLWCGRVFQKLPKAWF
jgi:hypothetical protein